MSGRIDSLNVVHAEIPDVGGSVGVTAIDKRPVTDRRGVTPAGVAGDHRADMKDHGSEDQAVYAYASEDYAWWCRQLGRELPAGVFGENLTTSGIDVTHAVIGATWRMGTALLQVSAPRIPCGTFQRWMAEERWVKRFTDAGRPGTYLRVLEAGELARGDAIEIVSVPGHGVTVLDCFRVYTGDRDAERLRRVAACEMVDAGTREKARRPGQAARPGPV
jgi:MOSC domain-containing protein YiiM